jgi:ADP-ribose pyrophosphatase YjhB (NUDIX family)
MSTGQFKKGVGAIAAMLVAIATMPVALAQSKGDSKIVCWKDAAGKVIGCGDKVPPEYAASATKELDKTGNVRKTGDSAEEAAKRKAKEQEQAQLKAEEQKRAADQKRQDSALLSIFTNDKEIDLKRDRELQAIDNSITQQSAALKVANERLADAQQRAAAFEKTNKDKRPLPQAIKEDLARAENQKGRLEQDIAAKEKSKQDTYAAYRKRFQELKGGAPAPAPAPATTAAAPASAPAPAKK